MPARALPLVTVNGPTGIATLGRCVVAVVGVALFFTNLDSYAAAAWTAPDPVKVVVAVAGVTAVLVLLDPHRPTAVYRSPLLAWVALYFLVTTAWAIWTPPFPQVVQELHDRYRSILFLVTFAFLFDDPRARRAGTIAVAIAVAAGALINVAEFLSLATFADDPGRIPGRAAGFHINPNASGLALALGFAAVSTALPKTWRAALLLLSALGIAATFSRGAWISLALVSLWLVSRGALGPKYVVVLIAFCAVLVFTAASGYVESHGLLDENTSARVHLQRGDSGRGALAFKAWEMFAESPLTGNGLGSTRTWDAPLRAHNMFLTLASDHGVLGLILFPALGLAIVARRRSAAGYALVLMASGFTSHAMLQSRYALLLTALAAAGSAPGIGASREMFEEAGAC